MLSFVGRIMVAVSVLMFLSPLGAPVWAQDASESNQVMEAFRSIDAESDRANEFSDPEKHVVMFIMGFALLALLLITAGLGIAMGVYGKQTFVLHMLFAGLSLTLAVVHSVVAIVWFNPF